MYYMGGSHEETKSTYKHNLILPVWQVYALLLCFLGAQTYNAGSLLPCLQVPDVQGISRFSRVPDRTGVPSSECRSQLTTTSRQTN